MKVSAQTKEDKPRKIKLKADYELRFEIDDMNSKVFVTLISGMAELFGAELVERKKYEFVTGTKVAIFTYHGCVLEMIGKPNVSYCAKETPMVQYMNCHAALEQKRTEAEKNGRRGPVVLIIGPKGVGKNTLCRILLNYAVRQGRRPLYVDIDVSQGTVSIPGCIASLFIESPISIADGFAKADPLVYHFGEKLPNENNNLYKALTSRMAETVLEALNFPNRKKAKSSGIIINTCGWMKRDDYLLHIAEVFEVNVIFVVDHERLYTDLRRALPTSVQMVSLPKSGGVVERSPEMRTEEGDQRIKEYFYGNRLPLHPFSFEVKFQDFKLYKFGAEPLPNSCIPAGVEVEDYKTKLVSVAPSPQLQHHILSVSFAETPEEDVIGRNVAGFICVTKVDMEKQLISVLSPQPRLPQNKILLLSAFTFIDSHQD